MTKTPNTTPQPNYPAQITGDKPQPGVEHAREFLQQSAAPLGWLVHIPSSDTQNVYDSQDDASYVDDLTNNDDAVVTPLYAALQAAPPAPAAVAVPEALRELIEAIEFTPLGVRAILAMTRARAALAAAPAQAVAVPGKALPYEPTSDMLIAAREHDPALPIETIRAIYWSMWRTAPAAPAQEHATQLAGQGQDNP